MDNCKEKRNKYAEEHIKEIQNAYKQKDIVMKTTQNIDKEKQRVVEKVFFYKPYNVDEPKSKTSEPQFI